ncbi:MAG: BON domain-containing protein [Proteobacteria bacterium]|nr:BON domain-containing protein [Pseudomonadota bacterium]
MPMVAFADMSSTDSKVNPQNRHINAAKEKPSDTAITTNVKASFLKQKLFGDAAVSAFTISVETTNGVVHLTGTADNQAQVDRAVKLSKAVDGVKSVVPEVQIKSGGTD